MCGAHTYRHPTHPSSKWCRLLHLPLLHSTINDKNIYITNDILNKYDTSYDIGLNSK